MMPSRHLQRYEQQKITFRGFMNVPFIDLKRLVEKYRLAIDQGQKEVMDQTFFVGGPPVIDFEKSLASKLQTRHAIGCSNGTDALVIALQAAGVRPGMKVAVPNLTFWATVEAVCVLGAEPVFVDNDSSLQMSFEQLQLAHKEFNLDAVVMAHLYGWASPQLGDIRDFCKLKKLPLVEDAAQAYGVKFKESGDSIFKDAFISTLSFYPAKVIGACGDAGAITTGSDELNETCRVLLNHGRSQHYSYSHIGWNARMSGTAASFLNVMLEHDEEILVSRRRAETYYREMLQDHSTVRHVLPPEQYITNGYLNVCLVKPMLLNGFTSKLKDGGIGFGRTYPETMDVQPAVKGAKKFGDLINSRNICQSVVNLPLFAFMTDDELSAVANIVN